MSKKDIAELHPKNIAAWKKWLDKNHMIEESVWLVFYNKKSGKENINWSEAVDVALCYGWIDSKKQTIDEFSYRQFYSKRKAISTWSKINKDKVAQLIADKQMKQAGLDIIVIAKENGSWTILDEVEALIIPQDLEVAFKKYKTAKSYFQNLSKTKRKMILQWIVLAKKSETRQKRINEIALLASEAKIPKQFL